MKFRDGLSEEFEVPMRKRKKEKKINPNTNRGKTSKKTRYLDTEIPPEERSFDNMPKYADGSSKVRFQDGLEIDTSRSKSKNWGGSKNGSAVGGSHRAVCSFKKGDEIKSKNSIGKDTSREIPYKIKSDKDAENHAIRFAKEVS